jgi:hypothetical protein
MLPIFLSWKQAYSVWLKINVAAIYSPPFKDAFRAKSPSGMAYAAPFDAKNPSTLDLKWFKSW